MTDSLTRPRESDHDSHMKAIESLRDLERAGGVRLPHKAPDTSFLDRSRPQDLKGRSLEILRSEREEGW